MLPSDDSTNAIYHMFDDTVWNTADDQAVDEINPSGTSIQSLNGEAALGSDDNNSVSDDESSVESFDGAEHADVHEIPLPPPRIYSRTSSLEKFSFFPDLLLSMTAATLDIVPELPPSDESDGTLRGVEWRSSSHVPVQMEPAMIANKAPWMYPPSIDRHSHIASTWTTSSSEMIYNLKPMTKPMNAPSKPFSFPPKNYQEQQSGKYKKSAAFMVCLLMLMGVTVGALVALDKMGVVDIFSRFRTKSPDFSHKLAVPLDPSQQLIIPANIPSGLFGCSNLPTRAPLWSSLFPNSTSSPGDKCSMRYTLTECDILATMRPASLPDATQAYLETYVRPYILHLLTALEMFDLNCYPDRLSSVLATIRHETNGLTAMEQKADGGSGSIHLLPRNFGFLIQDVPVLRDVYTGTEKATFNDIAPLDQLPAVGVSGGTTVAEKKLLNDVGNLLQRPENTFLVAGWWFKQGSQRVLGFSGCGDLRTDADAGKGLPASVATINNTTNIAVPAGVNTGFYKVSECVFGTSADAGEHQRLEYYDQIMTYATQHMSTCQTKNCLEQQ